MLAPPGGTACGEVAKFECVLGLGYVGIGTNAPAYTLDVNGSARVSGNLFTLTGSTTLTGSYVTIFTGGTQAIYLISVGTGASDGTGATFMVHLEDGFSTILSGNNILITLSGNSVQLKSYNAGNYNITWTALKLY